MTGFCCYIAAIVFQTALLFYINWIGQTKTGFHLQKESEQYVLNFLIKKDSGKPCKKGSHSSDYYSHSFFGFFFDLFVPYIIF